MNKGYKDLTIYFCRLHEIDYRLLCDECKEKHKQFNDYLMKNVLKDMKGKNGQ